MRHLTIISLLLVCVVTAACAPPAAPVVTDQPTAAAPARNREKRTITAVVGYPIIAFAPMGQTPMGGNMVTFLELHSNGLATSDAQGRPVPQLARELPSLEKGTITVSGDGRMTTVWSLRTDATWHDGTRVTAADVVLGYRAHADAGLPFSDRTAVPRIESVTAVDDYSVSILWKAPFYLADSLGPLILFPLPAHLLEQEFNLGDKERFQNLPYWTSEYVHTGPFRVTQYERGSQTTFEAHDGYFQGRPKVDRVIIREILDRNAAFAAIAAGDVDLSLELLDAQKAVALQERWVSDGGGKVVTTTGATFYMAFQFGEDVVNPSALLDPRVRRALYFALDRGAITELAYGDQPAPLGEARSILGPTDPMYPYVRDVYAGLANSPQRAQQLFTEAGWTRGSDGLLTGADGRRLAVEIRSSRENIATASANMWRQAGIDSSIVVPPPALAQDREYGQAYPGVDLAGSGEGDRILNRIHGATIPTARNNFVGTNRGHYANPTMNDLIERYRSTLSEQERGRAVRQIADLVGEELPLLLLYYNPIFATVGKDVRALDDLNGGKAGAGYFGAYSRTAHLWDRP